jgi:dolichol-phosphate mannosyltransferase
MTARRASDLKLSIVVPCFNEQESLPALHERITGIAMAAVGSGAYEIILVNDGSVDNTWPILRGLAMRDGHVVAVNMSRNHGHQLALSAGLSIARGERTLILDADLQDPPELLPRMMQLMDEGADVVFGQRTARAGESAYKRASAALYYRVLRKLVDIDIPPDVGDFRLLNRQVLDALNGMPERQRYLRGMISWIGFKQVALPYSRDVRLHGKTKYPFRRMVSLGLSGITSFSTRPLRIASVAGGIAAIVGFLAALWSIYAWSSGATIPGWTSVIVVVLVLGGIQLLVIGILGEYLGRLFMEAKGRPAFIIADVVSQHCQDSSRL